MIIDGGLEYQYSQTLTFIRASFVGFVQPLLKRGNRPDDSIFFPNKAGQKAISSDSSLGPIDGWMIQAWSSS
jgi:hypothetical protein